MKLKLELNGGWVEFARLGRVVFIRNAAGAEDEQGFFDDAAAEAGLQVMIDARLAEGWKVSAETLAQQADLLRAQTEARARMARHEAVVQAADPRAALRHFAGSFFADATESFEALLQHVTALEEATDGGFRVRLEGGGAIEWSADQSPLVALWLYVDERDVDLSSHSLYFGADAGPPEPPDELADVDWFLEELPNDRYWYTTAEEPERARAYEFDGGLVEDLPAQTPSQVLAARLVAKLSSK